MAELKPLKTVDIRGAACGMSVAKANLAIKGFEDGQVLEVLAEAWGAGEILVWVRAVGHELIAVRVEAGLKKLYILKEGGVEKEDTESERRVEELCLSGIRGTLR